MRWSSAPSSPRTPRTWTGYWRTRNSPTLLGLDLVCLQDHPYAAQQGDMWTLLSVIGARTTAVRLAPNVASLPLRPPVVLAKAAATLDLVTGGRVELGLGAGAFWDGIAAAGGPRRTPREAVDALIEAIADHPRFLGRRVGAPSGRALLRQCRAAPGPVPAHDIPIWLGAYKPRMLRVTAQLADVWIPSMGYADPPALPAMNAAIDEAARSPPAARPRRCAGPTTSLDQLRPGLRFPQGQSRRLGRAAGRTHSLPRDVDLSPRQRRPPGARDLRPGGRAGGARVRSTPNVSRAHPGPRHAGLNGRRRRVGPSISSLV
jgi:alkanesulfonate monooxygenase SsuD/methylene tetrahydromethanopterin reductase-like flavin-dependent oxidoreductase (luciferase family)